MNNQFKSTFCKRKREFIVLFQPQPTTLLFFLLFQLYVFVFVCMCVGVFFSNKHKTSVWKQKLLWCCSLLYGKLYESFGYVIYNSKTLILNIIIVLIQLITILMIYLFKNRFNSKLQQLSFPYTLKREINFLIFLYIGNELSISISFTDLITQTWI